MKITRREQGLCWLWLKLGLVVGLSGAANFVLPAAVLAGGPGPSSTIRVRVNNYTQASDSVLASAEREANRIFGEAGLAVVWLSCPTDQTNPVLPDPCREGPEPADIILRILSAPASSQFQDNVFGFAVYPLLATVYYDRVLLRARSDDARFEIHLILGAVIVHEIGHLLIGSNGHSNSGVMQPSWDRKQIRQAVTGTLLFTPEQARLIRQLRRSNNFMKSARKQKRRMSAETIARFADQGKDVSRFFTNTGQMLGPIERVPLDFASAMLEELDNMAREYALTTGDALPYCVVQSRSYAPGACGNHMTNPGHHFVAVIGGAISGSVAAEILADHGIRVAVFEQNTRPYGKIEDGLPRWHVEQRKQEYARIDARMKKQNVHFIPSTKLGRDFDLPQLFKWGFSAVILANGAWRDRELGVPEAENYVGKGLIYQNPFIYWYNHKNEKDYLGPRYETPDEVVVVGGGLASIDVVKVLQLENYERALKARGINTNMHELEKGIPEVCKAHGIKSEELGVKGCLLIYRRREQDMPLAQPPDNATPEQVAKTEQIRQKMLRLARDKYLFRVQDRRLTTGIIVENGRLVGLKLVETKIEGRKAEPIPGSEHELRAPLVISSIGSVPEKLSGINMNGEYYTFAGEDVPRYTAMGCVFGVGNVVTGQGNIRVSLVHSQKVTKRVVDCMKADHGNAATAAGVAEQQAASAVNAIGRQIEVIPQLSDDQMAAVERQVHALQQNAGYTSDYDSWIAKVTPPDLE